MIQHPELGMQVRILATNSRYVGYSGFIEQIDAVNKQCRVRFVDGVAWFYFSDLELQY